jgi:hypothetical protein
VDTGTIQVRAVTTLQRVRVTTPSIGLGPLGPNRVRLTGSVVVGAALPAGAPAGSFNRCCDRGRVVPGLSGVVGPLLDNRSGPPGPIEDKQVKVGDEPARELKFR